MTHPDFIPLDFIEYPPDEMQRRAEAFYAELSRRRTVREFSDRPVPRALIETCLLVAGTAPNGANLQPWHFVAVADLAIKRQIREAAEALRKHAFGRGGVHPGFPGANRAYGVPGTGGTPASGSS